MPFDAVFLTAVADELRQSVLDARIDKIQQPTRDTVVLLLRGRSGNARLLLTAGPNHPRVHLTRMALENPAQPPMFCMLLRKHLSGGRIINIQQPPMERVVTLTFSCTDEMGSPTERRLILEAMGRNSNLILCGGDGRIIDCLRRVDFSMSEQRQVLPGLYYHLPPTQGKLDPTTVDTAALAQMLQQLPGRICLDRWLMDHFAGLSPLICRELSFSLTGETEFDLTQTDAAHRAALASGLSDFFAAISSHQFTPILLRKPDGRPADFTYRPILQYGTYLQTETPETFSQLLDLFYAERDTREQLRQRALTLRKALTNQRDRVVRKMAIQRKELEATHDRERKRQLGDIVTANLHRMQRGQSTLRAVDFYDPQMAEVSIPLSPKLSPQQNAAKFYKEYNKAKTAEKMLTEQIARGENELDYLCSILESLDRAENERDIQEIRLELEHGGYLRAAGSKKRIKTPPTKPLEFRSSDGFTILVGKNNRQNDQLTLKTAQKSDLWLHTQKIHGSHVIILCQGAVPPDQTVTEAMMLAAYYSQAREGQGVPVDYTPVRYVKKPGGAKPGMVVYERYRTGFVTPDPALIEALRPEK